MDAEFTTYVRKPFLVEAVEVTEDNIETLSSFIGDLRTREDGVKWIYVDRRQVPNVYRVFPGYFVTRLGDHIRCYTAKVFAEQFTQADDKIIAWVDFLNNGGVENSRVGLETANVED